MSLPGVTGLGLVRFTDRDVILARTDLNRDRLFLSNVQSGKFEKNLIVQSVVGELTISRGWASVDVTVRGKTFRFLTTHLEAFSPEIQVIQANELLAGPGNISLPLIFAGDFNSNANAFDTATYGNLIDAGFVDAWSQIDPLDPGYTCCEAANLLNANPSLDTRIDLVLMRDGVGLRQRPIVADATELVGEVPNDKTPSGLWPSDHAGVVVKFHLGRPGEDPE
jgi:endonuclease/exonuclease/phosphatase family metal-dependent hydrolase